MLKALVVASCCQKAMVTLNWLWLSLLARATAASYFFPSSFPSYLLIHCYAEANKVPVMEANELQLVASVVSRDKFTLW